MPDSLDHDIVRAVSRFSGSTSRPLNIAHPSTLDEQLGSALSSVVDVDVVQIGVDDEHILLIDPTTSQILSKHRKSVAYSLFIDQVKKDHERKQEILRTNLSLSKQRMRTSLVAASIGFIILVVGIAAMYLGWITAGVVASASGLVTEAIAIFFFAESKAANKRVDQNMASILETEGYFRASVLIDHLPEGEARERLIETLVLKAIEVRQ